MSDDGRSWKISIYESQRAHEIELNRATAAFEHAVVAPLFLLNGGAAIAFLTLLGAAAGTDSDLNIDLGNSKGAVSMWAGGLFAATLAVGFAYAAQRRFTQSVNLRRRLIEHQLSGGDGSFRAVLTPLASNDGDPASVVSKARRFQIAWVAASALSSALFLAGVIFAAFAVIE